MHPVQSQMPKLLLDSNLALPCQQMSRLRPQLCCSTRPLVEAMPGWKMSCFVLRKWRCHPATTGWMKHFGTDPEPEGAPAHHACWEETGPECDPGPVIQTAPSSWQRHCWAV